MIPLPFAKGLIVIGEPIRVPKDSTEEQLEQIASRLETALTELQNEAERELGFA